MSRRRTLQAIGALVAVVLVASAARWLLRSDVAGGASPSRAAPAAPPEAPVLLPVAETAAPTPALPAEANAAAESPAAPVAGAGAGDSGPGTPHRFTGRVLDPTGAPRPGAHVLLVPDARLLAAADLPRHGRTRLAGLSRDALDSTTSGADGRFELAGQLLPWHAGEPRTGELPEHPVLLVQDDAFALLGHTCLDLRTDRYDAGDLVLEPGVALEGRVTDVVGAPLEGATVTAEIQDGWPQAGRPPEEVEAWWHVTTSDGQGRWRLPGLPDLPLTLHASEAGFVPQSRKVHAPAGVLTAADDLVLEAGAVVGGLVVDPQDRPVPGAVVAAVQVNLEWRDTPIELQILDRTLRYGQDTCVRADGEGRFVLGGLSGSNVSLGAVAEGFEPAVAHDIAPGRRDVVLALREPAELHVSVRDRATSAALVAKLDARPASGPQQPADSWREALPVTEVPGRPGEYLLRGAGAQATRVEAVAPDHARAVAWAEGLLPGARGELAIEMEPGHALAGRVIDQSDAPVRDAGLTLERRVERGPRRDTLTARSDAEGGFRFADLPSNTYDLTVQADGFALVTLAALQFGDEDLPPLEVRLQRAGDIEGLLLDAAGQPARGFQVEADFPGSSSTYTRADTSGRFALRDLLPGTWKLSSVTSGEVPVEVRAGETAHVELRLAPPSYILGRVTCGGQPVAGAHLMLRAEGMPWVGSTTPADGRFKIQVAALTWTVEVSTDVGGLASATVEVLTGESRHVDFVLPSGALVVHATGPHGEPARRALLRLERPADPPPGPGADPEDAWERLVQRFAEEDGVARFAQIAAGRYRVRVGLGGDWVGGEPVEAQVADGAVDVTIVLHPAATIAGRVQTADGVPLPKGTMLTLYAATGERLGLRMTRLDGDGGFLFDCLEAGSYVVGVYTVPPQHLGDTPALAEQPVTLEEGQQAQVSLTLPAHD